MIFLPDVELNVTRASAAVLQVSASPRFYETQIFGSGKQHGDITHLNVLSLLFLGPKFSSFQEFQIQFNLPYKCNHKLRKSEERRERL